MLGTEVHIDYRPNWPVDSSVEGIIDLLKGKRRDEFSLGTSLSGPHRDKWFFLSGKRDYSGTASTGQLRLLSLTLRIVQAEYFTNETGRYPVLLMDDVLLELDSGKKRRFLEQLPPAGQAIFTFLPGEPWEDYKTASTLVYEVQDGRFKN